MNCERVAELAGRFVDGAADPGESAAIEAHRAACTKCAALIGELELLGRLHGELARSEPPAGMAERIVAAACVSRGAVIARAAAVAAAAAAVVVLGIGAGRFIVRSHFLAAGEVRYAECTGLEYLDIYPPFSLGEAIQLAEAGDANE